MSEVDPPCLPKYHQQPVTRPLFGQRPRIRLEVLSHWAARILFWSFYSSLITAVVLQFFARSILWDCTSICGNHCGHLPSVDLRDFGSECSFLHSKGCAEVNDVLFSKLDLTHIYPTTLVPQVLPNTCSLIADPWQSKCTDKGLPLAAWHSQGVQLTHLNRHFVVSLIVRNTPEMRPILEAIPVPHARPVANAPWAFTAMLPSPVARLEVHLSLQIGAETSCLKDYYWLYCPPSRMYCDSIKILTLHDVRPAEYFANVTVAAIQWAVDLPDPVLEKATQSIIAPPDGMNVAFFFHRHSNVLILLIFRYSLCGVALLWLLSYSRQMDFRTFNKWLPEQAWVFFVQILLIFYLNPFFLPSMLDRDIENRWQAKFYYFFEHPFQRLFVNFERAFELVLLESVRGGSLSFCNLCSFPTLVSSLWFCCTVAPMILHYRFHGWNYDATDFGLMQIPPVVDAVDSLDFWADMFLTWLWFVWILKSIISTHHQLKKLPYLQTRWRQLAFRFYVLIYISKVLQYLIKDFFEFFEKRPNVLPISLEDPPAACVADYIKNSVVVFMFAHVYMPAVTFQQGGPPAPGLRWWTKIKWPDKWVNWLERNGSAMYFFLYEAEKLEYAQAQRMQQPLHDLGVIQKLLENMGEFRDYIWENITHMRETMIAARLRLMAIPSHVRDLFSHLLHKRPSEPEGCPSPRERPNSNGVDADDASIQIRRANSSRQDRTVSFAHDLRDSHVTKNPFYCVELAVEMWNFSWEVYFKEPPECRPSRLLSAAEAAAVAVVPRFKSDGHVGRKQYLWNSVNSWKPFGRLPPKGVPLTISHWPLPTEPPQSTPTGRGKSEQHGRTKSSASLCWSDLTSELDGAVGQTLSQFGFSVSNPSSGKTRSNPTSPSAPKQPAVSSNNILVPGGETFASRVKLDIPIPLTPTGSVLSWPPLWLKLHNGAVPEPGYMAPNTPLYHVITFLSDADLKLFQLTCKAASWLVTEWRPLDMKSSTESLSTPLPRSALRPPRLTFMESLPSSSNLSPFELHIIQQSNQPEPELEGDAISSELHIRGPSDIEEALLRMVEPSIQQLEMAMRPTPKKKTKRRMPLPVFMNVKQYGYELYAVINWNNNQAVVCENKEKIVVAFRGTDNLDNVMSDVKFMRTPVVQMLPHSANLKKLVTCFGFEVVPKAHSGFYEAYNSVRADTLRAVRTLALARPHKRICCTGHSLGGALAIFAAYDIVKMLEGREVSMYNFGGPRVGNNTFRLLYDHAVPDSYRTVNDQDVVPSIPPPVTLLGGMFHHVGKEVRIDAKGNMIIQPTFLEKSFVSGNSRIGPHKMENYKRSLEAVCLYFGMELSSEKMPARLLSPLSDRHNADQRV